MKIKPIALLAMIGAAGTVARAQQLEVPHPSARYEDGMFSLPELNTIGDNYLLVITSATLQKPMKIVLPPGATGLRVSPGLLPKDQWTWSFRLNTENLPDMAVRLPRTKTIHRMDLDGSGYLVSWEPVEGADKYLVAGKATQRDDKDGPASKVRFATLESPKSEPFQRIPLKPGMHVDLHVTAIDKDGIALARSDLRHLGVEPSFAQEASNAGFRLQRSDTLSRREATLPAFFGYLSEQSGDKPRDAAYQAQFALLWDSRREYRFGIPTASLETRITSSGERKSSDASILRAGLYKWFESKTLGYGTEATLQAKVEHARKDDINGRALEISLVPIYGPLGVYHDLWKSSPGIDGNSRTYLAIAPLLALGADVGRQHSTVDGERKHDTIKRFSVTLRADAESQALARFVGAKKLLISAERTVWRLPLNENKTFKVTRLVASLSFTDEVSLDYSYLIGHDAPTFNYAKTSSFGLGLKF